MGSAEKISFLGLYIKDLALCFSMKSLTFTLICFLSAFSSPLMAQKAEVAVGCPGTTDIPTSAFLRRAHL
jgi:hypothetical protein